MALVNVNIISRAVTIVSQYGYPSVFGEDRTNTIVINAESTTSVNGDSIPYADGFDQEQVDALVALAEQEQVNLFYEPSYIEEESGIIFTAFVIR